MFAAMDHIGVAVEDLDAAVALHAERYGLPVVHREVVADQGVEAVLLEAGEGHVELLAPLADDTPVGRHLARRGPGLHHVAYRVDDVGSELRRLRDAGLRLVDDAPRAGLRETQVAFLHPAGTGGVLTELVQAAETEVPR